MKILAIGDFHGKFPKKFKSIIKKEKIDLVIGVGDYAGIPAWQPYILDMFKRIKAGKERISLEQYFGKEKKKKLLQNDFKQGKKVLTEINKLSVPIIYIFGNGDDEWYRYPFGKFFEPTKRALNVIKKLKNMKNITYSKTKFQNINFIGLGGYMDPDKYLKDRKEDKKLLKKTIKRNEKAKNKLFTNIQKAKSPRVFVFHYPPIGVFDKIHGKDNPYKGESVGISIFNKSIKKYKPLFALCGHMHEYQGMKKLYNTPVINPGEASKGKAAIITLEKKKLKVKFIR